MTYILYKPNSDHMSCIQASSIYDKWFKKNVTFLTIASEIIHNIVRPTNMYNYIDLYLHIFENYFKHHKLTLTIYDHLIKPHYIEKLSKFNNIHLTIEIFVDQYEKVKKEFMKLKKPVFVLFLFDDAMVKEFSDDLVKILRAK